MSFEMSLIKIDDEVVDAKNLPVNYSELYKSPENADEVYRSVRSDIWRRTFRFETDMQRAFHWTEIDPNIDASRIGKGQGDKRRKHKSPRVWHPSDKRMLFPIGIVRQLQTDPPQWFTQCVNEDDWTGDWMSLGKVFEIYRRAKAQGLVEQKNCNKLMKLFQVF